MYPDGYAKYADHQVKALYVKPVRETYRDFPLPFVPNAVYLKPHPLYAQVAKRIPYLLGIALSGLMREP